MAHSKEGCLKRICKVQESGEYKTPNALNTDSVHDGRPDHDLREGGGGGQEGDGEDAGGGQQATAGGDCAFRGPLPQQGDLLHGALEEEAGSLRSIPGFGERGTGGLRRGTAPVLQGLRDRDDRGWAEGRAGPIRGSGLLRV